MTRFSSQALLALTLILVATGFLVLSLAGFLQPVQSLALRPISSLQNWVSIRTAAVRDLVSSPREMSLMRARIAELESENARLQQELVSLQELASEVEALRSLVNFAHSQPESRYRGATVIGRDTSPFLKSIWISAGSDDGLAKGMPVVTSRGLVGRIAEVFATASRVQLISDPEGAVNVQLQMSRSDGILEAQLNGELWVNLIDQEAEIEIDELILTSGLGGSFPPDIPVGRVISVRKRDFELFQQAIIQPAADLDELEQVLVITNFNPLPLAPRRP